jgi:hypothetical protein
VESTRTPGELAFEERVAEAHETDDEPVVANQRASLKKLQPSAKPLNGTKSYGSTVRRDEIEIPHRPDQPVTSRR